MTLIAGLISENKVTVLSDIGITFYDKSKYDYTTSIVAGEALAGDTTFIKEMCHKIIILGENAILAFSGAVEPALDRVRMIKATYDNDNPEESIRWVLDNDFTDQYSFITGIRTLLEGVKLIGFNVNGLRGVSYSSDFIFSGSGMNNEPFLKDAKDLIETHYSLNADTGTPLLMVGLTDLIISHKLKDNGVSGPVIGCSLTESAKAIWHGGYSIVYYNGATMEIARCLLIYVAQGIARYFSTSASVGNQRNWILGADRLVSREQPLQDVAAYIDKWDKVHRSAYRRQLDTFQGAPMIFIDERSAGPKKMTFVSPTSKSRAQVKVTPDEIEIGNMVASGYDIQMARGFATALATPLPNSASKIGIIVSL